ncbi:TPA: 16S rRNA (guanine(1405)-N(7))-methyltransferase RmtA [Pseudomonas aeruginosa]|uniref:16S rRNA (guanine(1405)-N(7))-methyltransferase n=1 Tax=Pseudomonas aeruginosa TaxID=287 RepID=Q8GRA1_PSEAI|nr:16S rRNA (guanine(1405)-N(7))-methyltransferase RmtA [Pseudomonas aeruginosa]BAC20579.1 16S rRNA methylase [Pseudomonas aeruginosa]BAD12551.1 16S rRNA methylase [Pseudomonas aeruginosa]BCG50405.1 16S rRNA (guanine(1405)-N(7))-methyltransferase RmtA [Expression vector pUC57-Amp-rmtA]
MSFDDALASILSSKKYRSLCPDTVRRILDQEWGRHKSPKLAVEATRTRLHGICGAYVTPESLKAAAAALSVGDVQKALSLHASTKERLAELDCLYDFIFSGGVPHRVLDIACGLNPLALFIRDITSVWACDIHQGLGDVITPFAHHQGLDFTFALQDVMCTPPTETGDLALVFKLLPLLEREQAGAAMALLQALATPRIAVSFPTRSLGGRGKGMEANYSAWFEGALPDEFEIEDTKTIGIELVYMIKRNK